MIRMTTDEFLASGLLEQYVMGLLDDDKAIEVGKYIEASPGVKDSYNSIQETIANMAKSYGIEPPVRSKEAIIRKMNEKDEGLIQPTRSKVNWLLPAAGIAAAIFLCLSVLSLFKINNLEQQLEMQAAKFDTLDSDCKVIRTINIAQEQQLAFYTHHATRSKELKGSVKGENFQAVTFYNTMSQQIAFDMVKDPKLPKDKCFYLWGDLNGEMIKISKINSEDSIGILEFDKNMASLNITIEDATQDIDHPDVSQLVASVSI